MSDQAQCPHAQKRIMETSNQTASEGSDAVEVATEVKDERGSYAAAEKLGLLIGSEYPS